MLRQNGSEALGADAGPSLDRLARGGSQLQVRRVATDNRLHPWEWLETPDGRLLKADAVDHCAGHDLIGCQDIAWDIVGAGVELSLSAAGQARLAAVVAQEAGRPADGELRAFLTPCYLAFQLGAASMAADAAHDPAEARRLRAAGARYAARLRDALRL